MGGRGVVLSQGLTTTRKTFHAFQQNKKIYLNYSRYVHAVEPPDGDGGRGGVAAAGAVLKYRILSIEIADFSEVRAHVFNVLSRDSA